MNHQRTIFALAAYLTLISCANANAIYRRNTIPEQGQTEVVDADQRVILTVPVEYIEPENDLAQSSRYGDNGLISYGKFRVCAEAAPEVFSASALAAAAQAQANQNSEIGLNASLSLSEVASTIERTQTINLIRESMYRTCERFLSGAIDATTMQVQAARDQRAMVAILAIEQLTGVVKRQPTVLSAEAQSTLITANDELIRQQVEESRRLTEKQEELDAKELKSSQLKSDYEGLHEGKCDSILETTIPDPPEAPKPEEENKVVTTPTLAGGERIEETTTSTTPEPSPEEKEALEKSAALEEQKAQCGGAKTALQKAEAETAAAKSARDAAGKQVEGTRKLLEKMSTTLLSTTTQTSGDGDQGSNQNVSQVKSVAADVEKIVAQTFDPSTEMVYVCATNIAEYLDYAKPTQAQALFIQECFNLVRLNRILSRAQSKSAESGDNAISSFAATATTSLLNQASEYDWGGIEFYDPCKTEKTCE